MEDYPGPRGAATTVPSGIKKGTSGHEESLLDDKKVRRGNKAELSGMGISGSAPMLVHQWYHLPRPGQEELAGKMKLCRRCEVFQNLLAR